MLWTGNTTAAATEPWLERWKLRWKAVRQSHSLSTHTIPSSTSPDSCLLVFSVRVVGKLYVSKKLMWFLREHFIVCREAIKKLLPLRVHVTHNSTCHQVLSAPGPSINGLSWGVTEESSRRVTGGGKVELHLVIGCNSQTLQHSTRVTKLTRILDLKGRGLMGLSWVFSFHFSI